MQKVREITTKYDSNKSQSQEFWKGEPCAFKVITLDPKTHRLKLKRDY